ncbi:MAG: porin [Pseudomonadota bacterium]
MTKRFMLGVVGVVLLCGAGTASAVENVKINGYASFGATYLDMPEKGKEHGLQAWDSFIPGKFSTDPDIRAALQFAAKINEKLDFNAQLFGRPTEDEFKAHLDWVYLSYHLTPQVDVRVGRNKTPLFLLSDYIDVGYAYPWVRPPQEVYSSSIIESLNGVEIYYKNKFGGWRGIAQVYFGSNADETTVPQEQLTSLPTPGTLGDITPTEFSVYGAKGVNLSLSSDILTLRAGYFNAEVDAEDFSAVTDNVTLVTAGASLNWNNLVVYTELFQRDSEANINRLFPNQKGHYATFGYRFGKILPYVTTAKLSDNGNPVGADYGTPLTQKSTAFGVRFEMGDGADLKFEVQNIKPGEGSRGLFVTDPRTMTEPQNDANLYSIVMDVVF